MPVSCGTMVIDVTEAVAMAMDVSVMGDFGAVLFRRFHRLYTGAKQCVHAQNCVCMLRNVRACS